jgi:2C-methyl-D-erythritol 2,4-cyclodiphosphate synthase
MPFGLTNGPAIFQQFINKVFMDYLNNFIIAFVDNILIYSDNKVKHQEHVKKVLKHLRAASLQASIKKCEFLVTQTKYLGFIITSEGIKVNPEKMAVIYSWNQPTTI